MRMLTLLVTLGLIVSSCQENSTQPAPAPENKAMAAQAEAVDSTLAKLSFASKKDPSCGMPLKAGLTDTSSYKGKLYGFCSKECKEDFLKDPEAHLAALK
ncbi:MAG: YHS domain-containing protein [Bacteroidota bacterium]|nr:YHS domain-containing protein [Bacteroidota bacterium]